MGNKLRGLHKARTIILGAATLTVLWLPSSANSQTTTQDRQTSQADDVTRRDVARFDQFLDSHREIADQLRKTPSSIDDPQFLQSHPELNAYLQDHPSVKQEISEHPDSFMRLEDQYRRDASLRDRDAGGQDQDRGADRRDATEAADFNRFLDEHREIAEQVRKDPSLADNREFVQGHPELQSFLQDHPGVRDQLRQDPNAFMQQADRDNRDANQGDRDAGGQNGERREAVSFDRFLDSHREIAEQVRKDPSLADNRSFLQSHPALETYLWDNPGVREQLRQDPNAFMHQADADNRGLNRDAMHDHMADFGGFLGNHSDIKRDLSRNPGYVKDHEWVQNHGELDAYLNAHPDVRTELMANPQDFVHGAQQYTNGSATGSGAGMSGRGTGTTGTGITGTTGKTTPETTTHTTTGTSTTKPNL